MATKVNWADYAILQATGGGKEWKVQVNDAGIFRCNCPSFIFSGRGGATRTCKHCRRCETQRAQEATGTLTVGLKTAAELMGTAMGAAVAPAAVVNGTHPLLKDATAIFAAMCEATRVKLSVDVSRTLGMGACRQMVEVLAVRLATYVPAKAEVVSTVIGVRRITFSDDDD